MKIALIGEYSSLHKYLKDGLQKNGISDVTLFSSGDGWKKINGYDVLLPSFNGNFFTKIKNIHKLKKIVKKVKNYDVVQLISINIFPVFIMKKLFRILKKNNRIIAVAAAGGCYSYAKAFLNGKLEYNTYKYNEDSLKSYTGKGLKAYLRRKNDLYIEKNVDVIIPSLYEYSLEHNTENVSKIVPFPINIDEIKYNDNIVNEKIVFFHGLNNEKSKGTKFIVEAFSKLKKEYGDKIEIIVDGHLPFDEYKRIIEKTNVIVDQCCTYGYGINACISGAMGKIVLTGCRRETLDGFGFDSSPFISLKPDSKFIYDICSRLIDDYDYFQGGKKSRMYVENNHNSKNIANEYLNIWESYLLKKNQN